MKWIPLFTFGLIGASLLVVSTIYAVKTCLLLGSGIHTRGKVVEMVRSGSTNAEAGYLRVEFQTKNGETIRFTGNPDDAGSAELFVDAARIMIVECWTGRCCTRISRVCVSRAG